MHQFKNTLRKMLAICSINSFRVLRITLFLQLELQCRKMADQRVDLHSCNQRRYKPNLHVLPVVIQEYKLRYCSSRTFHCYGLTHTFQQTRRVTFYDTELRKVISDIEHLMDTEEFDHVLINGDINWHRTRNNAFTRIIEEFLNTRPFPARP